jgi:Tfp pilus assembly protein PilO
MNKLTKEKKMHLAIVVVVTAGIIAGLWFGLITMEQQKIRAIASKSQNVQNEIAKEQKVVTAADQVDSELAEATNKVARIEAAMPSGDLFSWIVSSLKQFNVPSYKVDMPQISAPRLDAVAMFPNYPYNEATVSVSGSAYYYEFGKFLADFENHFPYTRVQNLNLEPGLGTTPEEREKLNFHMDIVILVKPNTP